MVNDMKETSKMTGGMAMVNSNGLMVECTTAAGSKASNMAKVLLSTRKMRKNVVSGEMERESSGSTTNILHLHYPNTNF